MDNIQILHLINPFDDPSHSTKNCWCNPDFSVDEDETIIYEHHSNLYVNPEDRIFLRTKKRGELPIV